MKRIPIMVFIMLSLFGCECNNDDRKHDTIIELNEVDMNDKFADEEECFPGDGFEEIADEPTEEEEERIRREFEENM